MPVQEFYEPKYINGKPHWYTIKRKDEQPFTVAGIYDDAVIYCNKVRSFSMLTINSDHHPFMKQFHAPKDEKRSIIVIPEQYRKDWLTTDQEGVVSGNGKYSTLRIFTPTSFNDIQHGIFA